MARVVVVVAAVAAAAVAAAATAVAHAAVASSAAAFSAAATLDLLLHQHHASADRAAFATTCEVHKTN